MKVLITGGTGFLGTHLTKRLLDEGLEVRLLSRSKSVKISDPNNIFKNCEIAIGDIRDKESIIAATKGVDGVFHLAGLIAYTKQARGQMETINVDGTKNVLFAMEKTGVRRLLHLSSVVAIGAGFNKNQILNEKSEYNVSKLNLGYFETKRKAELAVFEAVKKNAFSAIVINPSTIYGPGDAEKGSRKVQLKVAQGKFPIYPPGGVNIVHVDDVVDLCMKAFKSDINGERFIAASENLTLHEVFTRIAKLSGKAPPRIGLPKAAIFAIGKVGDILESFDVKGPLNTENAWTSTLYHWFSHKKATEIFGFQPRPAQEALEASIRWSQAHGLIG